MTYYDRDETPPLADLEDWAEHRENILRSRALDKDSEDPEIDRENEPIFYEKEWEVFCPWLRASD